MESYLGQYNSLRIIPLDRSEGLPEYDISSLCVMGGGREAAENSSVVAQWGGGGDRKVCVFWLTFSSPLDLRTEISAQLCREITRTGGARLFCFDKNRENRPNIAEQLISGSKIRTNSYFCSKDHPKFIFLLKNHPI